jgi:predicted lipase
MKPVEIFKEVLSVPYLHTSEHQGSYFSKKVDGTLYLYFEKSNGFIDWKNNFDFPAKPYRDMGTKWRAHKGFVKVWKEIEPFLENVIMDKTVTKVIISGYSHGGAIAALAHEYVWFNRPDLRDNIEGYAFEPPRVFWGWKIPKALKERWNGFRVYRNGQDIVTHVPPVLFGYHHVGKMIHINKNRKTIVDRTYVLKCVDEHNSPNVIAALEQSDN